MAIIDADGLFHGERLAACSDIAQLYWPRFFIASNGYARLELSFTSIISKIFGSFSKPPTAVDIWGIFEEYSKNCLVILYEYEGVWWAQFDTSQKYLPRFKTVRDGKSPSPSPETMEKHRAAYLKWKSDNSMLNESFRKSLECFGWRGVGVGVGVGGGIGEEKTTPSPATPESGVLEVDKKAEAKRLKAEARAAAKEARLVAKAAAKKELEKMLAAKKVASKKSSPPTKTEFAETRHALFKVSIFEYWKSKNPEIDCPWQQQEGMQLELWLKSSPNTTIAQFKQMLRNRYRSDVVHSERPSVWIRNITNFANGPLDRYGKPIGKGKSSGGKTNGHLVEGNREALETALSGLDWSNHGETHGDNMLSGGTSQPGLSEVHVGPIIEGKT
jgi:hypothetical protein